MSKPTNFAYDTLEALTALIREAIVTSREYGYASGRFVWSTTTTEEMPLAERRVAEAAADLAVSALWKAVYNLPVA